MSVTIHVPSVAGQEALIEASVALKPTPPKIPDIDRTGKQPESRGHDRQPPRDHVSNLLGVMARLADHRAMTESAATSPSAGPRGALSSPGGTSSSSSFLSPSSFSSQPLPSSQRAHDASAERPALSLTVDTDADATVIENKPEPFAQSVVDSRQNRRFSPVDIAGLPDVLARYDSNGDGRIDQLEMKQVYWAEDETNSYEGLAQPRQPSPHADDETATQSNPVSQPRKIYGVSEEVDGRDAVKTYQQVGEGPVEQQSVIA